jgi:hypothetical protein
MSSITDKFSNSFPQFVLISGAPCIWVNVKNTLKLTYNSPITGDFGGPDNDSDEKPGHILGPDATTWDKNPQVVL